MKRRMLLTLMVVVWTGAWGLGYGLLYLSLDDDRRRVVFDTLQMVPQAFKWSGQLLTVQDMWLVAAAVLCGVAVVSHALLLLIDLIDRRRVSGTALRWSGVSLRSSLPWMACFAGVATATGLLSLRFDSWWMLLLPIAFVATLPFFCLAPRAIRPARPPLAFKPYWPGGLPVTLLAASLVVPSGISWFADMVADDGSPRIAAAVEVSSWIARIVLTVLALGGWVGGTADHSMINLIRTWLRSATLRPWIALDLWYHWILLVVVLPPVLMTWFHRSFLQAQLDAWEPDSTPRVLKLVGVLGDLTSNWWWIVIGLPTVWLVLSVQARVLVLCSAAGSEVTDGAERRASSTSRDSRD